MRKPQRLLGLFKSPTDKYTRKLKLQLNCTSRAGFAHIKLVKNEPIDPNIKSFRNEKSQRKSAGSPNYASVARHKSINRMVTLQTDRKHDTVSTNRKQSSKVSTGEDMENKCVIHLIQNNRRNIFCQQVGLIGELVNKLAQNNPNVIGFATVPTQLNYDYYLSQHDRSGTFLNGKSLYLTPVYKSIVKKIDMRAFQIIKCIGAGGFSKVFLVKFKEDGKFYAMKLIDKHFIIQNKKKGIVQNQRNIMKEVNHPFLLQMKFAFQTCDFLVFVLQYCPGGQLFNYVKKFKKMPEEVAKFYIIQILLGLQYLHERNIIYRDIKPQNILVDLDGHVKIADFGLAKPNINKDSLAHSFCGSPQYMAPQMIMKVGHTFPVDFYCLGALLYELVTGLPPFYSKNTQQIYEAVLTQELSFPRHAQSLSTQCKSLIKGLLTKQQRYRLGSLFGVKQILAHPWFGKIKRQQVLNKKLKPPVIIDNVDTLNFEFGSLKQNDTQFYRIIMDQQKPQKLLFKKAFKNFDYDFRANKSVDLTTVLQQNTNISNIQSTQRSNGFFNQKNLQQNAFNRKLKKFSSGTLKLNQTILLNSKKLKRLSRPKQKSPYNCYI